MSTAALTHRLELMSALCRRYFVLAYLSQPRSKSLNTIHVGKPGSRSTSEIDRGLIVRTFRITNGGDEPKCHWTAALGRHICHPRYLYKGTSFSRSQTERSRPGPTHTFGPTHTL
jgi:hypothetical protein